MENSETVINEREHSAILEVVYEFINGQLFCIFYLETGSGQRMISHNLSKNLAAHHHFTIVKYGIPKLDAHILFALLEPLYRLTMVFCTVLDGILFKCSTKYSSKTCNLLPSRKK